MIKNIIKQQIVNRTLDLIQLPLFYSEQFFDILSKTHSLEGKQNKTTSALIQYIDRSNYDFRLWITGHNPESS